MVLAGEAPVVVPDGAIVADQDPNAAAGGHTLMHGGGAQRATDGRSQRQGPVAGADMDIEAAVAGQLGGGSAGARQPARDRRLRAATSFFLRRTLGFS